MSLPKRTVKTGPEGKLAQLLAVLESRTKLLAFFFGLCFAAVLLVLAIWFPEPTPFQYTVFRITLALAASGVAGVIPGMIRLKVQPGAALLIHAGGALAVFVIVYLFAPAALPSELPAGDTKKGGNLAGAGSGIKFDNSTVQIGQLNIYGLTKEQYKEQLTEQTKAVVKEMQTAGILSDEQQLAKLKQQDKTLREKLANIQESYEDELRRRKSADDTIAQLKGKIPDAQIENAQASLRQGDKSAAEKLFDTVIDTTGKTVALAAYQSGRLAEDRLDYAKAMQQYNRAVILEAEKPEYLLAAGKMAKILAKYDMAQDWLEHLLKIREEEGKRDRNFASAQNDIAEVYWLQGHYNKAESLLEQAFQLREKILGLEHPDTLTSINNLAKLYQSQGRYSEAEPLLKQALQLRKKILGQQHPDTLASINNLAQLYQYQGRYSEAEPLLKQAFQLREKILGLEHPDTLTSINNLAGLYQYQGRYSEAEPLLKQAFQLREKILGLEHPDTLTSINNLAGLYQAQGRYSEAELLLKQAVQLREKILGLEHPDTLTSINNLAGLYQVQSRYSEAEQLCNEALQLREKVLGREHPDTLTSINKLAELYQAQGRYSEAEQRVKEVLQLREKVLGQEHPDTLATQTNYIYLLVNTARTEIALRLLQNHESRLLSRSFQELYASFSENVRRLYLQSIKNFQNAVFSLASQQPEKGYQQYAAEVMLRWKQVYAEESGVQHRMLNLSNDPEAEKLQKQLAAAQAKISQTLHQPKEKQNIQELIEKANQDETALLALARHLRTGLEVKDVTLDKVLSALPQDSGLIEYRQFVPVDFKTGKGGKSHLAALLLLSDPKAKQRFLFRDLGPLAEIEKHLKKETAEAYKRLLGPFDEQISNLKQLYIAPDGPLSLLSFASLRLPDGRFLVERQQINQLQTGRDLLADNSGVSGKGMVAVGGAKYGSLTADKAEGIPYLPESRKEALNIGEIFTKSTGEKPTVLIGEDANEHSLKQLSRPPRILHLSTSSFYLAQEEQSWLAEEAPLLLSGLALAGANNGLQGKLDQHGDDGLLYSLDVLGLNLHGTELVSLSACETGKGVVDYSEGVYGLVRAFRTAGAKNVLMTLTPVGDASSRKFMETFYDKWLNSEKNISPAEALHQTRLHFIRDKKPVQDWAPFVLVGK
ncbi:MAG: tetratricopeptide repeat protein [Candidatus Electronema sp. V4]|uniref:tetratricopeptide repeat protein n=1 Tax=Candidatus Electronema sp. V4 TaxID=3454756 RepID=UPI0040558EE4